MLGQLQKMLLVAYRDAAFASPTGDQYEVLINPESYSLSYGAQSNPQAAQGSSEMVSSFNKRIPQSLSF
jgi:hypothetical protein